MSTSASNERSERAPAADTEIRANRGSLVHRDLPGLEDEPIVILPSRLLPRTTLRGLIALTLLAAVLAAVARRAGDGGIIASSMLVGFAFIALVMFAGMALFMIGWIVGNVRYTGRRPTDDHPESVLTRMPGS